MPSLSDLPRARVFASYLDGWRRVLRAPAITVGTLAITFLAALPLAVMLGERIEADLGRSQEATAAADAWSPDWAAEFTGRADGFARTFTHEVMGFGGTLATTSRFADAESLDPAVLAAVAVYLAAWLFLWGGILDRFARQRPIRTAAFFGTCGVFFGRFLRLAVIVGLLYWVIFAWLHPLLFETVYDWWTRDLTVEREAIILRAGLYAILVAALTAVGLLADLAKVRAVVEDRRSMVGALLAAARFVRRRPGRLTLLYALNAVGLSVVVLIWYVMAPSASAAPWLGFAAAQIYLLLRLLTRLALAAAEVSFFQSELAHADYVASPLPVWPDSPTVEGLRNLRNPVSREP